MMNKALENIIEHFARGIAKKSKAFNIGLDRQDVKSELTLKAFEALQSFDNAKASRETFVWKVLENKSKDILAKALSEKAFRADYSQSALENVQDPGQFEDGLARAIEAEILDNLEGLARHVGMSLLRPSLPLVRHTSLIFSQGQANKIGRHEGHISSLQKALFAMEGLSQEQTKRAAKTVKRQAMKSLDFCPESK